MKLINHEAFKFSVEKLSTHPWAKSFMKFMFCSIIKKVCFGKKNFWGKTQRQANTFLALPFFSFPKG